MAEFNKEQETQKFKTAITDFFGITEGGEIKAGGITATAKHVMNAIFEFVQASAKDMDITGFEISSAGIGITFDLAKGYIETTLDGRDRSGASPELYARPDIHFFKLLAKGLVTGAADLIIGKKVKAVNNKMPTIIKTKINFIKNLLISNLTSKTFDAFFGSQLVTIDFTKDRNSTEVLERKYIIQDNLKQSLKHYWSDIKSDINSLQRVIIKTDDSGGNIIYYEDMEKDGNLDNTYEFPTNNKTHLLEFLKRFDVGYERDEKNPVHIKLSSKKQLITNYYANYGAGASKIESDLVSKNESIRQSARYSLKELKGYTLQGDNLNIKEYEDLKIYSNKHMDSRLEFFHAVIRDEIAKVSHTEKDKRYNTYYDSKTNTFLWNTNGTFTPAKKIVFVDGKYSSSASGKYDIFGYSNPDTINLTKNADNVYAELGLGSDTITTGSGNDTIYTNADIDDEFDTEDKNTLIQ